MKTKGPSKIYLRETIDSLAHVDSHSLRYWRHQARKIFDSDQGVHTVECVTDGRKTSSQIVGGRGVNSTPQGIVVVIASTGGKWGRSRREYRSK